ncbi:MAG: type II toxin-antitoxin system RelE family toxin [Nitrosotalea sp.]
MWILEPNKKFIKQYKSLSSNLQKKVDLVLNELIHSDDPTMLGTYKQNLQVYAYNLDKSNRLVYVVCFSDKVIELLRVGDHKKAYKGH